MDQTFAGVTIPLSPLPLIERSPTFALVAGALAKAQAAFTEIERNSVGQDGNRRFNYADFAAMRAATVGPLTTNGLALFSGFRTVRDGDRVLVQVQTELVHESGEYLRTPLLELALASEDGPKRIGAVSTYFRRYQARTLLGIADEEADGEGEPIESARSAPPPAAGEPRGNFRCRHGHTHTSAQGAKECQDAPAQDAGPGPLEPGVDVPAMNEDHVKTCREAIEKGDWPGFLGRIAKVESAAAVKDLRALYQAARYPKRPATKETRP
jgi:hypothetical protein